MKIPARWMLRVLGAGVAFGLLAAGPALAQSSSKPQSQSKPAKASPSHWGWFVPKKAPKPASKTPAQQKSAQKSAQKPATAQKTVTEGGGTPAGRPPITRTVTQTQSSGGVVTKTERVSIPGINGGSQNLVDQETQTVKVNDRTTRTIKKIYGQGPDGNRQLIGIERTDTTDLGGGKSKSESTYSQVDEGGESSVTRREVSETVPTGPHASVTNTTVFTPGMSGGMDPSQKIQETHSSNNNTEHTVKTVLTPNVNGGWQTNQKTVTVVNKQGKNQQTEDETLYAADANGNLTVAKRVVTRDWKAKDGKDHQETSTYTMTQGGTLTAQGGGLTLTKRVASVKTVKPNGTVETHEQTEERSVIAPSQGMQVTGAVVTVAKPTKGTMQTRSTVLTDDGNGQLRQVSIFSGQQPKPAPAATAKKPSSGKQPGQGKAKPGKQPH